MKPKIRIQHDCECIDFAEVVRILQTVNMGWRPPEIHRRAFENSAAKVFLLDENDRLVGFGRALSDGVYQSALYDIAVAPQYQGEGFGAVIVDELLKKLSGLQVILYATPGKEGFYKRFGFKKMLTAMGLFANPEAMIAKGFINEE